MAKRTRVKEAPPAPTDEIDDDGLEDAERRDGADLESVIRSEFGEAPDSDVWDIKVYRQTPGRGPMPYLFSITPEELPIMDKLRDKCGSGTYQARVFKNGRQYRIIPYVIEKVSFLDQSPMTPAAPAPAGGDIASVLSSALERQATMFEAALARRDVAPPAAPPTTMKDMVELMTAMRELAAPTPKAAPALGAAEIIALINQGVDLAQNFGGGERTPSLMGILGEVIKSPAIAEFLQNISASMKGGAASHAALSAPAPAPQAATAPAPQAAAAPGQGEPTAEQIQGMMMRQNLKYLVTRAAALADVGLYADWVADNLPRDLLEQIVMREDALAILEGIEPGVGQHGAWFGKLIQELGTLLTEPEGESQSRDHVPTVTPP